MDAGSKQMARDLTFEERAAVNALKFFEETADKRRLVATLRMSEQALNALVRSRIARPCNVVKEPGNNEKFFQVRFSINELYRYVMFICKRAGVEVQLDGSIRTKDNHVVSIETSQ